MPNKERYWKQREQYIEASKAYYQKHRERVRERELQVKLKVLTHYGNGKCACIQCGESRMACLSIDHIPGGGGEHLEKLQIHFGNAFYRWLQTNQYPKGYQTLCMNCQRIKMVTNNENLKNRGKRRNVYNLKKYSANARNLS